MQISSLTTTKKKYPRHVGVVDAHRMLASHHLSTTTMDRAMSDHQAHVKHMHVQNEDAKESIINAPRNTLTDIATTPTRKYDVAGSAQQHHHHHHHFHRLLNNNNNNNNIVSECSANFRSNQSGVVVGINVHVDASPKMLLPTPTNSNSSFSEGPPSALKSMLSREEEEERWHCTEEEDGVMVMGATPTPKTCDADDAMDALLAHSNSSECGGYLHDDFALLPASSSALSIRSAPMSEDEDDDDDDDECSAKPLTMGTNINNRNHGDAEKHDVCSVMRRDLRRCPPDQHPYLDMHRQQLLHADDRQKHHARYLSIMASGLGFLSETDSAISAKIILREAHRLHRHRRRARTNLFSSNHTIPTNSSMASTASSCTTSTDAAATSSSSSPTTTPPLHFTEVELDTSPAALEMQWRVIQREVSDDLRTMGLGFVQNRLSCMCLFDPHRLARAYGDNRRCLRMRLEAQEEVLCKLREQARHGGNAFFLDEHNNNNNNNTFAHNMSVEKNVGGVHGDDDDDHVSTMKEQQDDDVAPQWEPIQWESAASGATTSCACGADGAEEEAMHRVDQPLPSAPKIEGHSAKAAPSSSILPRVRGGDGKPPSFRKR